MRWWGAAGAGGLLRSRGASMLRGCGAPGPLSLYSSGSVSPWQPPTIPAAGGFVTSTSGLVGEEHKKLCAGPRRAAQAGGAASEMNAKSAKNSQEEEIARCLACRLRVEGLSLPPSWCVGCRQVLRDGCAAGVVVLAMHRSCHFARIIQRRNCSNNYGIPHTFVDSRWRAGEPEMRSADAVAGS